MVSLAGYAAVHRFPPYTPANGLLWKKDDLRRYSNFSPDHNLVHHAHILLLRYKDVSITQTLNFLSKCF